METRFEKGEPSNPSAKRQKRAGEFSRQLAGAQPGKDLREPSSPQSSEKRYIPKNIDDHEFSLEKDTPLPRELHKPIFERVLAEKFLDIYENEQDRCTAIEFLETSGEKSVARKFVEQLTDKRLNKDPETQLRMISAIGKLGDPSVVPKLLDMLPSFHYEEEKARLYEAIAGVTVMLDRQSAVPKLCEMLSDRVKKCPKMIQTPIIAAIGMSRDRSAVPKLREILSSHPNIERFLQENITTAINMLESSSIEAWFIDESYYVVPMAHLEHNITGKLGDISVARGLVEQIPDVLGTAIRISEFPRSIAEICRRSGSPQEIKELSDNLLRVAQKNHHPLRMMREMYKAVGELGKRLKPEDGKEISKELVAALFNGQINRYEQYKRIASQCIANAVFELEQHLAEPDPFKRILNAGEVKKEACKNIKEEILRYREKFVEAGNDISEFYEILSRAAFSDDTPKEMRIITFYPIMGTAGPSFAPKLEELAAPHPEGGIVYKKHIRTKNGWLIGNEEQQRMMKLAQYLRDRPSSSDAEHLPQ